VKWNLPLLLKYGVTEVKIARKMIAGCGLSVVPQFSISGIYSL
jgi:hypothetical protein